MEVWPARKWEDGKTYVAKSAELTLIHQRILRDEGEEDGHFIRRRFK